MKIMKKFLVPIPISGGLVLSYKCSCECKHCMYFGSPNWSNNWIDENNLGLILSQLSKMINHSPYGKENVSLNYGLHLTGGEPFFNYEILLKSVETAHKLYVPSLFVETNCYWCKNDEMTRKKLLELKKKGLNGILISVNPFILEYVPFERTERAIRISLDIFRENFMIYQPYYYVQFKELNIKGTLPIEEYLQLISIEDLKRRVELFKMGRAAYKLQYLYSKYPLHSFLNENCEAELVRSWHCHFDNYGNFVPGYCGGLTWGDIRNLDYLCKEGIDLDEYPILNALIMGTLNDLFDFAVDNFDYQELADGYVSKCHVCFDIRRNIALKTHKFKELKPREFYFHI